MPKRPRPKRTKWLQIRVSEEEHAEIEERAAALWMTISEYVRWRALVDHEGETKSIRTRPATHDGSTTIETRTTALDAHRRATEPEHHPLKEPYDSTHDTRSQRQEEMLSSGT